MRKTPEHIQQIIADGNEFYGAVDPTKLGSIAPLVARAEHDKPISPELTETLARIEAEAKQELDANNAS